MGHEIKTRSLSQFIVQFRGKSKKKKLSYFFFLFFCQEVNATDAVVCMKYNQQQKNLIQVFTRAEVLQ